MTNESGLFHRLHAIVEPNRKSDSEYNASICELCDARAWARQNAIEFEWGPPGGPYDDLRAPVVCLKARRGEKLVGQSACRFAEICGDSTHDRSLREHAECDMASRLMRGERSSGSGAEMICDLDGIAPDEAADFLADRFEEWRGNEPAAFAAVSAHRRPLSP